MNVGLVSVIVEAEAEVVAHAKIIHLIGMIVMGHVLTVRGIPKELIAKSMEGALPTAERPPIRPAVLVVGGLGVQHLLLLLPLEETVVL